MEEKQLEEEITKPAKPTKPAKKKGCALFYVMLITAIMSLSLILPYKKEQNGTPGLFMDAEFGNVVKLILAVPDDIPEEELLLLMNQTESLYLFGNIKSLEDLRYFPNLKVLSLSDSNRFKDIFYYSGEAESLSLNSISGIRYAGELEELQVYSQNIGDLSILKDLKKLKKLELNDCTFSNPEVIGECISLTELDLWRNSLRHLGFLEYLVNLKKLNLLENDAVFSEYESLGNLSRMENLTLYNPEISHIEFVRNMPDLRELRVIGGRVSDISPLSGHEKLESIVLDENKIKDLSTLEELERLKRLSINDNYVLEISSLKAMRELRYLSIQNNKVADISPLKNLPELSIVYLGGNPIEDISL